MNSQKNILIVEDEDSLSKVLSDRLKDEDFNVSVAHDGQEGLEIIGKEHPDLVLLDIVMPKMDGLTMMRKLRQSGDYGKNVPIIMLTNLNPAADEKINDDITKDQPAYYLMKSDWSMDDIIKKVKEIFKN
jgi:DNA-binding response OmpR family regulator